MKQCNLKANGILLKSYINYNALHQFITIKMGNGQNFGFVEIATIKHIMLINHFNLHPPNLT
jgi:hypothetical protein